MKINLTLLFACCLSSLSVLAQNKYSVKGTVTDSVVNVKLVNTTVCILNAKDSTLFKYTRVNANGEFEMSNLKKGRFILMISYPEYADYIERFQLDSVKSSVDFGKISLILKSRLLHEVMIKGTKTAIKIKGDTTEFNASSFVVHPNAKVEDLLKQLPGIEVDKDGKITAQGQTVSKVLVDGEEFFGDDPTLVTKNIRADMVDKVQLYDKKSDQATFTGIDDGVKNKTINIKLKEDKKNGFFGKVAGGYGTDKFYEGTGAFNAFKGKRRFSAYGTVGNDGTTGLSWEDANKYTGANDNMSFTDDGGIYFNYGGDDLYYNGQGIPVSRTGGLHFDDKWNSDKSSINSNYKTGYLNVTGNNTTLSQNNLPTSILSNNSTQDFDNSSFKQKMDATYNLKIDSLANLKVSIDGSLKNVKNHSTYITNAFDGANNLLNHGTRETSSNSDQKQLNATIFYNKKFMRPGRSFSVNVSETYNESRTTAYLKSHTTFYYYNPASTIDTSVNQFKPSTGLSNNLTSNITYSEPFTKKFAVTLNYGLGFNNSSSDKESFDQSTPNGDYDQINKQYSNNYKFNQLSNQLGAIFNYRGAKTIITFGTKATDVSYEQTNVVNGQIFKRSFLNWGPQANYQYKFSQQKSLSLYYNGSMSQPSINQIQPIVDNNDNLNLTIGNPDLKPSFRNNLSLNYNSYKVLSGLSLYVSGNYSFTSNPIVNNTTFSTTTGKSVTQYANLTSRTPFNWSLYFNAGQKVKPLGNININLGGNISSSTSYNYSNNQLNETHSTNYNGRVGLSKSIDKKLDIYGSIGPTYTVSGSSLQPDKNNNGMNWNGYLSGNFYLPGKSEIGFDGNYSFKGKTQSFNENLEKTIINAHIAKKFFAEQNLKISLACNDILNQNIGFNRNAYGTTFSQNSYTTIKRYFMFSISYDFSRMGGSAAPKN
ncbi:outer membrane beta-barrel protein [Mucilaginibacter sp. HMF5004]|uniref:outer membrane beta-barrel protein n=1 Tax=Mucilaginibacter rivuli TaxID=2857527 RepID=UPI001C5CF930|nr:outer membrane beta-barrel protein [Mucilaginibacter rivuli]MBW4889444.1 outer membrane beta-barrel protein [Mucilaginibacter rivuli]